MSANSPVPDNAPSENSAASSRSLSTEEKPATQLAWVKDVAVPAIVAIVALVGSYFGATLAYKGTQEAQRIQISEERAKVERDKRADVYLKLLSAAAKLGAEAGQLSYECGRLHIQDHPASPATPPDGESEHKANKQRQQLEYLKCMWSNDHLKGPIQEFLDAQNSVYIYGTTEAIVAVNRIAIELDLGLTNNEKQKSPLVNSVFDLQSAAYMAFRQVLCKELPSNPRPECR